MGLSQKVMVRGLQPFWLVLVGLPRLPRRASQLAGMGRAVAFGWHGGGEWMEEARPAIDGHRIIIGHGDSLERAEQLKQLIEAQFSPSEVLITIAGAAIGSHTGPGLLVIGYDLPA